MYRNLLLSFSAFILIVCASPSATGQFTAAFSNYSSVPLPSVAGGQSTFWGGPLVADFNKDGDQDVVVAVTNNHPNPSGFVILLGDGNGSFKLQSVTSIKNDPCAASGIDCRNFQLISGDFNRDGNLDLLLSEMVSTSVKYAYTTMALLYLGKGDGTFRQPVDVSRYLGASAVATADLRHTGKLDLISQSIDTHSIEVAPGNGDGTFQQPVSYDCPHCYGAFAIGDLGRGQMDIVFATFGPNADNTDLGGGFSVFLGNGDGTFRPGDSYPDLLGIGPMGAGVVIYQIVMGHFGPDHKIGISLLALQEISTNQYQAFVSNGNGDGTFGPLISIDPLFPETFLVNIPGEGVGDINGDGTDDVVMTAQKYCEYCGPRAGFVSWWLGSGDGNFSGPSFLRMHAPAGSTCPAIDRASPFVGLADLTSNGRLDAIGIFSGTNCLVVLRNAGTTTTLASNTNPDIFSNGLTLTAKVSGPDLKTGSVAPAAGAMSFFDNGRLLGRRIARGGQATFSNLILAIGVHSLTASYAGDSYHAASTSAPLQQAVNGIPTSISLTSNANPQNHNNSVTFTATISAPSEPLGKSPNSSVGIGVYFYNNGVLLAGRPVDASGTASITTKFRAGTHQITVKYLGDSYFAPSSSNLITEEVH